MDNKCVKKESLVLTTGAMISQLFRGLWRHAIEEMYVLVRMKSRHDFGGSAFWTLHMCCFLNRSIYGSGGKTYQNVHFVEHSVG
jgi:hypothetical protein